MEMVIYNRVRSNNFDRWHIPEWLLFFYLITVNINVVSTQFTAVLQNVTYMGFIAYTIYIGKGKIRISTFTIIYGLFLAFSACSLLWSISSTNTISLLRILAKTYVFVFFAIGYYNSSKKIEQAIRVVYACSIFIVAYVTFLSPAGNWLTGNIGKDYGIDTVRFAVRAALCAVLAVYYYTKTRYKRHLIIVIMSMILSLITAKRTGIVFFIVAIALFYIALQNNVQKKLKVIFAIILMGYVGWQAIFNIPILYTTVGQRVMDLTLTLFKGQILDASIIQRSKIMDYALKLFENSPIYGNGLNSMRAYLTLNCFEHITYAHNNFLEIATGLGMIGCILYYLFYLYGFVYSHKGLSKRKDIFIILMFSIMAAYLSCDLIQVTYESCFETVLFALCITGIKARADELSCKHSCIEIEEEKTDG